MFFEEAFNSNIDHQLMKTLKPKVLPEFRGTSNSYRTTPISAASSWIDKLDIPLIKRLRIEV